MELGCLVHTILEYITQARSKQKISAFNKPEMAVSAQILASFGTINTKINKFLTFLIQKIAEKAKRIKKMDLFRHICE